MQLKIRLWMSDWPAENITTAGRKARKKGRTKYYSEK